VGSRVRRPTGVPLVIAIDGPAGAGKSTIAAMLAARLGVPYLDTGAMYRAVALLALRAGLEVPLDDRGAAKVQHLLADHTIDVAVGKGRTAVMIDGEDVSHQIRTPECSAMASAVSALPGVRRQLVEMQRRIGAQNGGVIEGRDIGSVVFPDAQLKVFLTASPEERASRRLRDVQRLDPTASLQDVQQEQHRRDRQDSSRGESPLKVARGAVVVDTSGLAPEEVIGRLLEELDRARDEALDSDAQNTVRSRNDAS
jgi:cytidylate kinase